MTTRIAADDATEDYILEYRAQWRRDTDSTLESARDKLRQLADGHGLTDSEMEIRDNLCKTVEELESIDCEHDDLPDDAFDAMGYGDEK